MATHIADTEHGAFIWTGPYGGGKSSLALALACLFGAPQPVREQAAVVFGDHVVNSLKGALPHFPARWHVLPLVTERRSITTQLIELLNLSADATPSDVLAEIKAKTGDRGLLLIMDELGRGLEAAADGEGDLHVLQDIAELAARSRGKFVFLGYCIRRSRNMPNALAARLGIPGPRFRAASSTFRYRFPLKRPLSLSARRLAISARSARPYRWQKCALNGYGQRERNPTQNEWRASSLGQHRSTH